jgi:ParE toxin of type II toxin-antitoxin system, parDE
MQKYKVQYSIESVAQIKRITNWYKEINVELGNRFASNLRQAINTLKENPFNSSFRYDDVRYAVVYKFPYAAHYTINKGEYIVIIHAVFAFQENPEKWLRDLE